MELTAGQPAGAAASSGFFADHMFNAVWAPDVGWHQAELVPFQNLSLHPAVAALHYGQSIFEGMKAYPQVDGSIAAFRIRDNAARFRRSARRLAMPELPEDAFIDAVTQLVAKDAHLLPDCTGASLYLRPLLFATDPSFLLRSSVTFRFVLTAFIGAGFLGSDADSLAVYVSPDHTRAFPGGTGDVKVAGNYAPTFPAQRSAEAAGYQQVLWLDALERRWVEELSGMNVFLVRGAGPGAAVVTPGLTGTLLPGLTRDSLLTLSGRHGYRPVEERIALDQWRRDSESGRVTEAFACGTAASVIPITHIGEADRRWAIGSGRPGPVTSALKQALFDVQHGVSPDPDGWRYLLGRGRQPATEQSR